jgi:hypothetical protein
MFVPRANQQGNFLLQALLAIALIMAFMPFLASKLAQRKNDSNMSAVATHVNDAATAAREFIRANKDSIAYGRRDISGDALFDLLEPFGLPIGFIPTTAMEQKISLTISKNNKDILALVMLKGGDFSHTRRAQLMTRIGPNAATADKDGALHGVGGWERNLKDFDIKPDENAIYILIPADDDFSELVRRNSSDPARNKFHTNLSMGGFSIKGINSLTAKNAEVDNANFGTLSIIGSSDDRRFKNKIGLLYAGRAVFQTRDAANALNIARGDMIAKSVSAQSLFKYGMPGSVAADQVSVNSISMSVGRSGFSGMYDWDVRGDTILNNVSIDTELLEVRGFINASRGQDVFIDEGELTYSTNSGISAGIITAAFITLRDQVSSALLSGDNGAVILDIRPAGVSVLPDMLLDTINNDEFKILKNPDANDDAVVDCKSIISSLPGAPSYDKKSVSQNIICQYVFWHRLEQRINLKQCRIRGGC